MAEKKDTKAAAKKPAAKTAEKKPAAAKTAEKKPAEKKPAEKKTAMKTTAEKKPAAAKTAEKKPAAKTAEKKPAAAKKPAEKKPAPAKQMVVRRKEDNKWAVKKAGSEKATKLFNTKAEAEAYAKGIAKNQGSTVQKQKKDGKFQKSKY